MGAFKIIAALVSQDRYASLADAYGQRYMAFVTIVFAAFAAAAAYMVAYSGTEIRTLSNLQAIGAVTDGKIVELEVRKNSRKPSHQVWVSYRFEDRSGESHAARDYRIFNGPSPLVTAQIIRVIYDPANPAANRLAAGLSGRMDDLKVACLLCLAVGIFFGAYVLRFVRWRNDLSGAVAA